MKSNILRKLYLDYFASKGHKIIPSAPIIVKDDPTLMFTNAGMNQFKDIFLGDAIPKDIKVANFQKCLRVSGKHNDLEEVGHDTYHHTMFEMLGSWSFGDYFKAEAIKLAWEFLTDKCKLDINRIYVTVFKGSKKDNIEKDDEAFKIWSKYLPENQILEGSQKDNFWEMGETGPCGPCSEIHYDNRDDIDRSKINGLELVNGHHPQVIEIWNLVFMQYNRTAEGKLISLPTRHVDTGMGFERLAMILQGVKSNYDTDIFQPIISEISSISNIHYGQEEQKDIALRVVSDHIRAVVFAISDGQMPSNIKAGYVIRRILRRAIRYSYSFLNLKESFMYQLVKVLVNQYGSQYVELKAQQDLISKVIKEEEEAFLRTLEAGLVKIKRIRERNIKEVSGKEVFELYDTFGFPADLTALILNEHGISFNQKDFDAEMLAQKERSKQSAKIERGDWKIIESDSTEGFIGYNKFENNINITRYRKIVTNDKEEYQLVFNMTPFYPEGGGQVGDTGEICNQNESIDITDTKRENNLIIHSADKLPDNIKSTFVAKINIQDRLASSRNHTATHLLHEVLRNTLGKHVSQKGSLVSPNYLRFDFSHFARIEKDDLRKIELAVNQQVLANISLVEHTDISLSEAQNMGAIMLFGEKYDDKVRMIQFDSSKELCGGTHINSTGEIGLFRILSESSISSGIRRIEAITGNSAIDYINKQDNLLKELKIILKSKDIFKSVESIIKENKELDRKIKSLKKANSGNIKEDLLKSARNVGDIRFIAQEGEFDTDQMKNISFSLRGEDNLMLVLAAKLESKVMLSIMLTDELVDKGFNASEMIKEIAKEIDGGGGGQSFFATAGGKNSDGIKNAFERAKQYIE